MATKKRKRKSPPPRPKRLGRSTLVRLSEREEAAIRAAAGYEPIASFVRRIVMEYVESTKGKR